MVKNKMQLVEMSNAWLMMARQDLSEKFTQFMDEVGASAEELAEILDISVREVNSIVNGTSDISLSTFAKILIATDNVIEIKPISEMPQGMIPEGMDFGSMDDAPRQRRSVHREAEPTMPRNASRLGGMPMGRPIFERSGREGVPFTGMPMGGMQGHVPFGGMPMPKGQMPRMNPSSNGTVCQRQINLHELGRTELANLIRQNHWEREIDIDSSSRGELIDFLEFKETMPTPTPQDMGMEQVMPRNNVHTAKKQKHTDPDVQRITNALISQIEKNPQLKERLMQYIQ